jgi:LemA protein
MNTIFIVVIVLLLVSGLFNVIPWSFNIPALLIAVAAWFIAMYNQFVQLSNRVKEAWSDIEVQMKRRYNLIPNLVETVKGYAAHEKGVFESVTKARTAAMGAQTLKEHAKSENMLTGALKSLFAVAEAYPQLRANENFLELQKELTDAEDKIQAARRFYNGNVRDFNIMTESFPSNIIANLFRFAKRDFFELEEAAAREPVKVSF